MRKIAYLFLNEKIDSMYEKCLDLCSSHTPLVEPAGRRSVFLDLTGCGVSGRIIQSIVQGVYTGIEPVLLSSPPLLQVGLATSKLMAKLAAEINDPGICPQGSWRLTTWPEARIIIVSPGHESDFVAALPLNDFFPLQDAGRKLSRLGFSRVGEISALPVHQLRLISPRDGEQLSRLVHGEDNSPVTGLYPPFRITYPIDLEIYGEPSFVFLDKAFRESSRHLAAALEARHYACSGIRLEATFENCNSFIERQLSTPCSAAENLFNIFRGLFKQMAWQKTLTGLFITLFELAPRPMLQPDIFTFRVNSEKDLRQARLEELINNLTDRFPGSLKSGLQPDRREQVLACWDPWRMNGANGR